ncbi:hypothetical protein ACLK1U_08755 [Escherichia coli]
MAQRPICRQKSVVKGIWQSIRCQSLLSNGQQRYQGATYVQMGTLRTDADGALGNTRELNISNAAIVDFLMDRPEWQRYLLADGFDCFVQRGGADGEGWDQSG